MERFASDGGGGRITRLRLALRVVACGNAFSLRSNRTLVEVSHPSLHRKNIWHGANMRFKKFWERWWWGKDYTAAPRPSGRCLRQRFLATLESNLSRSFSSFPASEEHEAFCIYEIWSDLQVMVVGEGFEPSKSMTADLQSAPFGRSGTPPGVIHILRDGGGGRIIRRFAPHASGRCLWQRCLAFARPEP